MRIYLAQLNFYVGNLDYNFELIKRNYCKGIKLNADLVVFSELAISGYPALDLWLLDYFQKEVSSYLIKIQELTSNSKCKIIIGSSREQKDCKDCININNYDQNNYDYDHSKHYCNSLFLIGDGKIIDVYDKKFLPNHGVFNESRYFYPGNKIKIFDINNFKILPIICEDLWHISCNDHYIKSIEREQIDFIVVINASPFQKGKLFERLIKAKDFIEKINAPLIYVNQVGGQDSLIFDGYSFLLSNDGKLLYKLAGFKEDNLLFDCRNSENRNENRNSENNFSLARVNTDFILQPNQANQTNQANLNVGNLIEDNIKRHKNICFSSKGLLDKKKTKIILNYNLFKQDQSVLSDIYEGLVLSINDYIHKNSFDSVILGLSGGIDSALTAQIAIDALGSGNVYLYRLPSKFTSKESYIDAQEFCDLSKVKNIVDISIQLVNKIISQELDIAINNDLNNLTKQNIQARIRGLMLMAIANNDNRLLLSTSNKSETAVGYATIYGDMCGAFSPLQDLYKTEIYAIANWRNHNFKDYFKGECSVVIPQSIITKEPTAELAENQKDSDNLPEYFLLDQILYLVIEEKKDPKMLVELGYDADIVLKIVKLLNRSEYKRNQSAIAPKINKEDFDISRKMPITHKYIAVK